MKGLGAEYRALAKLDRVNAALVTPLIQLWDRGSASDDPEPAESAAVWPSEPLQEAIWARSSGDLVWERLNAQFLTKVRDDWRTGRPLLLDGGWLASAQDFSTVLEACRAGGFGAIPVTGLDRPDAYQNVVSATHQRYGCGAVLRLDRRDFGESAAELRQRVDEVLARLVASPIAIDLVIDLRYIDRLYWERDTVFAESAMVSLPHLGEWRNFAVAGSGMPPNAAGFPKDDIKPFPRTEWQMWQDLVRRNRAGRLPVFGDYGVIHPEPVERTTTPKKLPRIPSIRYTTNDQCLMVRGVDLASGDQSRVRDLFRRLVTGPDWCGDSFSSGDTWVAQAASGDGNLGQWGTWKEVGQSHHLAYVTRQIASSSAI
jgi:Beta protein